MTTPQPPKSKSTDEQIAYLRAVIDNLVASMATMQGNQGQLTVAVNRLQSKKIVVGDGRDLQVSHDPIASAARHDHKLLFPTYDGSEDPLGSTGLSNSSASKKQRKLAKCSWRPST
jgi:hypothetical protein